MTCKEAIERLHEFLDNELNESNYSQIKQHLDACHKCCEKFEFEQAFKKIIKEKAPFHKAPQHVVESIVNQWATLNEEQNRIESPVLELKIRRGRSILDFFTLRPSYVTMAVLLPATLVCLAVYLVFFRPADTSHIIKVAAERHDSFVNNNMHLDLVSSDRNEIRRHFKNLQRSNLAIDVPECNGREMKLLGCKNSSLEGKKSAYVGLRGNHNKISLEMVNGSDVNIDELSHELFKGRSYYFGRYKGYNVVVWRLGNTLYSLTSAMSRRGLMRVASESISPYNK